MALQPFWGEDRAGETPLPDPSGLVDRSIRTRAELNVAEAKNIARAVAKYLAGKPRSSTAPFTYAWFLQLHREMFGEVWTWAGELRTHNLNLGSPWTTVSADVAQLEDDLRGWRQYMPDVVEQAARLHHGAVRIHPFLNGNGRWSRMLANIWLLRHGQPFTRWPTALDGAGTSLLRAEYLAAIRAADQGDFNPLLELHRRFGE